MPVLLWRALLWRRAATLTVLAAAVVAAAAACLGPLYARSAEEARPAAGGRCTGGAGRADRDRAARGAAEVHR